MFVYTTDSSSAAAAAGGTKTQVMGGRHFPPGFHYGDTVLLTHNCLVVASVDAVSGRGLVGLYSLDPATDR